MVLLRSLLFCLVLLISASGLEEADTGGISDDIVLIEVDLPSRVVHTVGVVVILPRGLIYQEEGMIIEGAAPSAAARETIGGPNDGSEETSITWSFGDIDNRAGRDIKIAFRAVMADVAGNQEKEVLSPIRASVSWKDLGGASYSSSDESDEFRVVEPDLALMRDINAAFIEEGEIATFDISFGHSAKSSSTAFDVDVEESPPDGMEYIPNSMEILSGPAGAMDGSDPSLLKWHFDEVDSSWDRSKSIVLRYRALMRGGEDHGRITGRTILTWSSAPEESSENREYFASLQSSLDLQSKEGLTVSQIDQPDPISPGGILNYTISFQNVGQDARGVLVQEAYDDDVIFLSATPPPDDGTDGHWTIGDLLSGEAGSISVAVRVKLSAKPGTNLLSRAEVSSADGQNASEICITSVKGKAHLSIENKASSDLLYPGGSLNYTLTIRNDGDVDATNVTVHDVLDGNLEFYENEDASLSPTQIWRDQEGTHLWWSAEELNSKVLKPGETRMIDLSVRLPPKLEKPSIDRISNLYRADSDQIIGAFRSLETFIVQSLFIRKKSEKDVCSGGDILNYTILYGNRLDLPASDAVVMDRLPDVIFITASPEPNFVDGNLLAWRVGTISPKGGGSITLSVRVEERPEMRFLDSQSVRGSGSVSSLQRLSTAHQISSLTNYVNITAYYPEGPAHDSSYANTRLRDALGVDVEAMQHGSGYFEEERLINYSEKSISIDRGLFALGNISAPNQIGPSSWANRISARNHMRDEHVAESHLYTDEIIKDDHLLVDSNQTVYSSKGEFSAGVAYLSYDRSRPDGKSAGKKPSEGKENSIDVSERYHGSYKSEVHLDSYGRGVSYSRQASGFGFVSSDMRQYSDRFLQRSYEHGAGSYRLGELLTSGSTIYKDTLMNYTASHQSAGSLGINYSSLWDEGMSSEDREYGSRIVAAVRHGSYIRKEALMDSSSLSMTSEFSGLGSIKAAAGKGKTEDLLLDEAFLGSYRLDVTLGISRIPKYLGPHLNVTKRVARYEGDRVHFVINVTNDGNKTIAPLEITDLLPPGLTFINSSLRPRVDGQKVRWSLLSLSIGETRTVELQVQWDDDHPAVMNEVEAVGHCADQAVTARAVCAIPCLYNCRQTGRESRALEEAVAFEGGQWRPSPCMGATSNLSPCLLAEDYSEFESRSVDCSCDPVNA